jgi:hypothetical protein
MERYVNVIVDRNGSSKQLAQRPELYQNVARSLFKNRATMNAIILVFVVCTNMGRDANNCGGTSAYNADEIVLEL